MINQNSFLQDFALPFHDMVLPDPGFEDMHKVTHCYTCVPVGMMIDQHKESVIERSSRWAQGSTGAGNLFSVVFATNFYLIPFSEKF